MFSLLYVDDEPGLLEIGQLFLENTGEFTVRTVSSGKEALDLLGHTDFDAIISDYQMPEMDGIELLKTVRKTFGNIPFILFTGRGREEIVIEAIDNGVDSYLQKGGDPRAQFAELAHRVHEAIGRRKAETALSDSERRLSDIINFLPDATFAIDTEGSVIAWNRAIEEMTGIPARDMLGKGDYEYAIPFYGTRRPILIDLVFEDEATIAEYYVNIRREGNAISAETSLPHPKGKRIDVLAKASPLYNRDGEITGAIEAIRDISDRHLAEEELRAANDKLAASSEEMQAQFNEMVESEHRIRDSEEQFRSIVQNSPHPIAISDAGTGKYVLVNMAFRRITGYSEPEIIGKDANDLGIMSPVDQERRIAFYRIHKKIEGEVFTIIAKGGGTSSILLSFIPITINNRPATLTMAVDITEKIRDEQELRAAYEQITASDEKLREQYDELLSAQGEIRRRQQQMEEIAGTVPGVVFQFYARPDGTTGMYYVSSRSEEIFGFDNSTADYLSWFMDHIYPDDKSRCAVSIREAVQTGKRWEFEGRFVKPSGEMIWFQGISSPRRHGNELVYSGVLLDVTAQKKAGDSLRESGEMYRSLVETTNTGYVILDEAGRVIDANPEYIRLTGRRDLTEIAGHNVVEWTADYMREKNAAAVRQCIKDRFIRNFEIDYVDAAGHIIPVEINATVVYESGKSRIITLCRDITERKRETEALAESERKYRLLTENSPDMIYFIDSGGCIRYVNEYAAKIMGGRPGDIIGKSLSDLFDPGTAQRHLEGVHAVIGSRQPSRAEMFESLPSGGAWLDVRLNPLIDERGNVLGVLGLSHDISDRKNAESALARLSRMDKEALGVAHMGHFEFDVATQTFLFNDQYYALIGTTSEKSGGYSMPAAKFAKEFAHPDDAHLVAEKIQEGIETADPRFECRFESRIIRPDGDVMWVDVWFRIEKDSTGKTVRFYGVNQDITERKLAEEGLHESEMKYRMLVESSNDIIYTMTTDGILTFVSPSWTVLLGHPTEEVIGRSYREFVHPDDIATCMAAGATLMKTKERRTGIVYRVFHADGSIHSHVSNISPVQDEKGNVVSYIGNARDITDMKRSENAIRESNRKLNLLNSITRHDLANQLTVVQGYTQLAMIRKPDPVITEFIAKIAAAAEVMQRQIEFTRNYQDLGVQAPAWHRVSESVLAAKPENIALTCSCRDWEVFADPMIGKVFFNLFDNAIRHGGKVTAISVGCGLVSGELVITVEDNGVGIPLDEKQKIFGKGFGKNTGFGLFLVREILAITGIFIHETGAHGRGARFEITVPKGAYRLVNG
jgi:PAS domain S-box-containing protein